MKSNTFVGGLYLEQGNDYELGSDDAIRLVALGKADMVEAKELPKASKVKSKVKEVADKVKKKASSRRKKI